MISALFDYADKNTTLESADRVGTKGCKRKEVLKMSTATIHPSQKVRQSNVELLRIHVLEKLYWPLLQKGALWLDEKKEVLFSKWFSQKESLQENTNSAQ